MTSTVAAAGEQATWRPARVPLLALGVAAVLAVPLAAVIGEAATAPVVADPGAFVRWGVLYARVVHDLAAAVTIGLLVHAAYLVPETTRTNRRLIATRLAGIAAGLWALAGAAGAVLSRWPTSIGIPLTDPAFGQQFTTFAWSRSSRPGSALITAAVAAVISLGAARREQPRRRWPGCPLLAVLGVLPLALAGHAAGPTDHSTAVNALAVHLVGVTVWVGGLLALALLRPLLAGRSDLAATAARYSTLAGWCFGAVALSGLQSALIRIGPLAATWHPLRRAAPGQDGGAPAPRVCRVAAPPLAAAPACGPGRSTAFVRLVVAELVVMGVAMGTAVALARSAPPVPDDRGRRPLAGVRADRLPRPRPARPATRG